MALTTTANTYNPAMIEDAVQGEFANKNVFVGSAFVATGAVVVDPSMSEKGNNVVGQTIKVPYFGTIGDFQENLSESTAATPRNIAMVTEEATITRDSLATEASVFSQFAAVADPYQEAARQIRVAATRAMDKRILDAIVATGVRELNYVGSNITWDMIISAKASFGDEMVGAAVLVMHSQSYRDALQLKDTNGRPLLLDSMRDGDFPRMAGIPIVVSDRVSVAGSTMGAVTEDGTTPPDVTLTGTPLGPWDLKIQITVGGSSDGTAKFKFSTDDGSTWSDEHTVTAGGGAYALNESRTATNPADDSLVGFNGATGVTATFTNGTYNVDNNYRAEADLTPRTLLLKPASCCFWYNRAALTMQTDKDILKDSDLAAMHLYAVAHRYRRRRGSHQSGVISIRHDVANYDGTLDN